jgi:uncharacterized protein YndB with AHSA1/START domain
MNWTKRRKRRDQRRLALRAAIALAGLTAILLVAGLCLGAEQVVRQWAMLERPPETVWRVLLDLDGMPLWRSDVQAIERLPDLAGRPAWRERGRGGVHVMELSAAEPPVRLVLQRTENGRPALPMRTFELAAVGPGTLVTVTERTRIGNPIGRLLRRLHPPRGALGRLLRDLEHRLSAPRREVVHSP